MSDYRCLRPVPSKNFPGEWTRCLRKDDEHAPTQGYLGACYGDGTAIFDHPFQRSSIFELQGWARR